MRNYTIRPAYALVAGHLESGYYQLAKTIVESHSRLWLLDGLSVIDWQGFRAGLENMLAPRDVIWVDSTTAWRDKSQLPELLDKFVNTNDPVYGRLYSGVIADFYNPERMQELEQYAHQSVSNGAIVLCYGPGSARFDLDAPVAWLSMPSDLYQQAGWLRSVHALDQGLYSVEKSTALIDFPVIERHAVQTWPRFGLYIDMTDLEEPVFIHGDDLRASIAALAKLPFRMRTQFYPSAWGGQWVKGHLPVEGNYPNVGWTLVLVPGESGVIFADGAKALEVPLNLIVAQQPVSIQGTQLVKEYGATFPIRFSMTDTISGTDLSVQVHPKAEVARRDFGTRFTENETYYIFDTGPDSKIYLGLQDDADLNDFREACEQAYENHIPFNVDEFVASHPSSPHRMFQIPAGTVHFIGKNNIMMEIVSAHTIHTYRFYDHMRKAKDGSLRPVHIDNAFESLNPENRNTWVKANCIETPRTIQSGEGWEEQVYADRPWTDYAVNTIAVDGLYTGETGGERFHVLTLVEGEEVMIEAHGVAHPLRYLETILIPAGVGTYTVRSTAGPARFIKTYMK